MSRPLAIDLCTGLHGWSEGLVAAGWRVIGFDIEDMCTQFGVARPEHVQLVIQNILTLHGSQFKTAALIVASPPCQGYSYRAMPWKRAKALPPPCNALFEACFRIQREACEAAGRHIPLIVENVRGAQPWVGRARWNYGSFYLWGDVPALMPVTFKAKVGGFSWSDHGKPGYQAKAFNGEADKRLREDIKNTGGSWFNVAYNKASGHSKNPVHALSGLKHKDQDGYERSHPNAFGWKAPRTTSKGKARKYASAMIAKIPLPLSRYIADTFKPVVMMEAAE